MPKWKDLVNDAITDGLISGNETASKIDYLKDAHDQLKEVMIDKYEPNKLLQQTEFNAICLKHLINGKSQNKKLIRIKARIPELHSLLPVPDSEKDFEKISFYPTFTSTKNDIDIEAEITPGTLVSVTFDNMSNFASGKLVRVLQLFSEEDAKKKKKRKDQKARSITGAGPPGPKLKVIDRDEIKKILPKRIHPLSTPFASRMGSKKNLDFYVDAKDDDKVFSEAVALSKNMTTPSSKALSRGAVALTEPAGVSGHDWTLTPWATGKYNTYKYTNAAAWEMVAIDPGNTHALRQNVNKLAAVYDILYLYWSIGQVADLFDYRVGSATPPKVKRSLSRRSNIAGKATKRMGNDVGDDGLTPIGNHKIDSPHKFGLAQDYGPRKFGNKKIGRLEIFIGLLKLGIAGYLPVPFHNAAGQLVGDGGGLGLYWCTKPKKSDWKTMMKPGQENFSPLLCSQPHHDFRLRKTTWHGIALAPVSAKYISFRFAAKRKPDDNDFRLLSREGMITQMHRESTILQMKIDGDTVAGNQKDYSKMPAAWKKHLPKNTWFTIANADIVASCPDPSELRNHPWITHHYEFLADYIPNKLRLWTEIYNTLPKGYTFP